MLPKKKHQLFEEDEYAKLDSNMVNSENFFLTFLLGLQNFVIPVKTGIQTLFLRRQETIILETGFPASSAGQALLFNIAGMTV
jgi:hypothetical protein